MKIICVWCAEGEQQILLKYTFTLIVGYSEYGFCTVDKPVDEVLTNRRFGFVVLVGLVLRVQPR